MTTIQFTRYLYEVTEVKMTLTASIINKRDDALFWAFELFHSGLDLVPLLWSIYYDFFASLNPGFEKYLTTHLNSPVTADNIGLVVSNFMIRPHNSDVFIIRNIVNEFEIESSALELPALLKAGDYIAIAKRILDDEEKKTDCCKIAMLARIIGTKSKRNLYVKSDDVSQYETRTDIIARKVLPTMAKHTIDPENYLSLFRLPRDSADIKDAYLNNWLYHASFTPLWAQRIRDHNGTVKEQSVVFATDDDMEEFYEKYGLEPDEQKAEVQQKSIRVLDQKRTWLEFYKQHNKNSVITGVDEYVTEMDKLGAYYTLEEK
jgi:hypothetical protein